uniref:NmrA-like domain-containing protein n=1 Tax=Bostrychia simpliciuscula TaxID=324754 RepID=A0A1Z1M7K2_9FLOR|nr:hypothetical protein [Bostrychia simpliciuscula]ARW62068.1 hypothetical protein [Bostrychia simpliciuscula]
MSLLVIGSTGTLGRQIVKKALNDGFQVKCLVRNFRKAAFLKEWGAELIYGDLTLTETIPVALHDITAIIDSSTTRINDLYNINEIDLKAKYILIEAAIKAKIKRYIFFSILNSYDYTNIPLVKLKLLIQKRLKKSKINYTIFNLSGFFQGIIPQYAVPILDDKSIWITNKLYSISYINTQDIAKVTIKSLSVTQFQKKILPLLGNESWNSFEIVELCEKISGKNAKITKIGINLLKLIRYITKFFQWTWNISERLSFIEILSKQSNYNISIKEILYILKIEPIEIESLEIYLSEYFEKIMTKLKEVKYEINNNNINQIDF